MKSKIVIALSFIFFLGYTGIAQTIGDGCMNIEMVVEHPTFRHPKTMNSCDRWK